MGRSRQHKVARKTRALRWAVIPAGVLVSASVLAACSGATADTSSGGSASGGGSITLYNGQHEQLTDAIVSAFEKQTGIHVKVRSDDGIVLADQILQEGSHSRADVYLTENSPELMLLTQHKLLATLPSVDHQPDPGPVRLTDRKLGGHLGAGERPGLQPLAHLTQPASGQHPRPRQARSGRARSRSRRPTPTSCRWSARSSPPTARTAALNWLNGLKDNATSYADIESVVAAVNKGQVAVGIINQYYWYRLKQELGAGNTHSKVYYFPNHNVGGLENISGAAVLASSSHKAAAEKFVSFLVSAQAEKILAAGDTYEYPVRPGSRAQFGADAPVAGQAGGPQRRQPRRRPPGGVLAPAGGLT